MLNYDYVNQLRWLGYITEIATLHLIDQSYGFLAPGAGAFAVSAENLLEGIYLGSDTDILTKMVQQGYNPGLLLGWTLDETYYNSETSLEALIFRNAGTGERLIFLPGTTNPSLDNYNSSNYMFSDAIPATAFELVKLYKKLEQAEPDSPITLAGHSLGASLAKVAGAILQSENEHYLETVNVYAFAPWGLEFLLNNMDLTPNENKIINIYNSFDGDILAHGAWEGYSQGSLNFGKSYFSVPSSPTAHFAFGNGTSPTLEHSLLYLNFNIPFGMEPIFHSWEQRQEFYTEFNNTTPPLFDFYIRNNKSLTSPRPNDTVIGTTGDDILVGKSFIGETARPIGTMMNFTNDSISGLAGDDILFGDKGNDTLIGGDGNDTLYGSLGNDTFIFNKGDDTDTLLLTFGDSDTLKFEGFTRGEVSLEFIENSQYSTKDLVITRTDTPTDKITIVNQFLERANQSHLGIEYLTFDDGNILIGTLGNDNSETINFTSGNDMVYAFAGDDALQGAVGNDTLYGGTGNDTYHYALGDGDDVIVESGILTENNVLDLSASFAESDLSIDTSTDDKIITFIGHSGSVTIKDYASNSVVIRTSDGDLGNNISETYIGRAGNDKYNAFGGDDTVYGDSIQLAQMIGGDDSLMGGDGNDTIAGEGKLVYRVSDNNYFLTTFQGGDDTLLGGNGDDLLVGDGTGLEVSIASGNGEANFAKLVGAYGDDYLSGGAGDDTLVADGGSIEEDIFGILNFGNAIQGGNNTLVGGTGNDLLIGGNGNDQYLFNSGDGDDVIVETAGFDQIVFGTGIEKTDLSFLSDGDDQIISYGSNSIRIVNQLRERAIDEVLLDDGTRLDYYEISRDISLNVQATILSGQAISGSNGVDYLHGNEGADSLSTGDGDDILDGGEGNDELSGGNGNDVYNFKNDNWGNDTIADASGNDTLDFSVLTAGVTVSLGAALSGSTHVSAGSNTVSWSSVDIENVLGGRGNDHLIGNAGDNYILGNEGGDTLSGGGGNDTLEGGIGDDTYAISGAWGTVSITDLVGDNVLDLSAHTNALTLDVTPYTDLEVVDGSNSLTFSGSVSTVHLGSGNDEVSLYQSASMVVHGNAGNDTITGQLATDTLYGDAGNDVLTAGARGASLYGGADNDTLIGSSSNDLLDGGTGIDSMTGGYGDDTYVVDSASDVVVEVQNEFGGTDTIQASLSYTLGSYLENLTLTGSSHLNGTGNSLDNYLQGNSGNNSLVGGAGNDTLNGGSGVDTLVGGSGNDLYVVDHVSDVITELTNEGVDTVQASISYTLGSNLENLALTGSSDLTGTGNSGNNIIQGNAGHNLIDGGLGVDTLYGGAGNDIYIVDNAGDIVVENANEGTDTIESSVSYYLGAHIENLTLTGSDALTGFGNELDNVITGNIGDNLLFGAGGNDTLIGGLGNDEYFIEGANDTVTENSNEGIDTVYTAVSYTLGNHLENLALLGAEDLAGTGNGLDNVLLGNEGDNTLTGQDGDDTLDGGLGEDSLIGGLGNDTYYIDHANDEVVENAAEGNDTVFSSLSYSLGTHLENLTLLGNQELEGFGNSANNVLTGNAGDNLILGYGGNDTLDGFGGTDILEGGLGNDIYVINQAGTTVTEFIDEGTDTIQLGYNFAEVSYQVNGSDLELLVDSSIIATISGQMGSEGYRVETFQFADNVILSAVQVTDLLNNSGDDDTITGTSASETLIGSAGNDTISGLDGHDLLIGHEGDDSLLGGNGNDTLNGGLGNDSLEGGDGDDTYLFTAGWGTDIITDALGNNSADLSAITAGLTVDLTSGSTQLTDGTNTADISSGTIRKVIGGSGNDTLVGSTNSDTLIGGNGADSLNGNFGNDVLEGGSGNDTLTGGSGNDSLDGGTGNDTYRFAEGWGVDTITSDASGIDILDLSAVVSDITVDLDSTGSEVTSGSDSINWSGTFIENVATGWGNDSVTGSAQDNVLNGGQGADTLIGEAGNDTLIGGSGNDSLDGGAGNDLYQFEAAWGVDTISTGENAGVDTVDLSAVSSDLTISLESSGSAEVTDSINTINWAGNVIENVLAGSGHDAITGNSSNNLLNGGAGNDTYYFANNWGQDTIQDSTGVDILDFQGVTSHIVANLETGNVSSGLHTVRFSDSPIEQLYGGSGNDQLIGNASDNLLVGNNGQDTLEGGAGNDTLSGGTGNDTYRFSNGWGDDIIHSTETTGTGFDTVDFSAVTSNLTIQMISSGGAEVTDGVNTLQWSSDAVERVIGGQGNDTVSGTSNEDILIGHRGNDTLEGGAGNDRYVFNAGDGQDVINDATGDNVLQLGAGILESDLTFTSDGSGGVLITFASSGDSILLENAITNENFSIQLANSTILSSNDIEAALSSDPGADDYLPGTSSDETLLGGEGNDYLVGDAGNDSLVGGAGNDTLLGGDDNDTLIGGTGNDTLEGGAGNDTYIFGRGAGQDTITDSAGIDILQFDNGIRSGDVIFSADSSGNLIIRFKDTTDQLTLSYQADSWGMSNGYQIESFVFQDVTYTAAQVLSKLQIIGTSGDDTLSGSNQAETILGDAGNDYLLGGDGNNTLYGGDGNDYLLGGYDNDYLVGGNDQDTLIGSVGNDTLYGGAGNDTLDGGDGNDLYLFNVGDGEDILQLDASGVDTLRFGTGLSANTVIFTGDSSQNLIITFQGRSEKITLSGHLDPYYQGLGYQVENFVFNDVTYSISQVYSMLQTIGTNGDDFLTGSDFAETLLGGAGNDYLIANEGHDTLMGGDGNDFLSGGNGNDYLLGGNGRDELYGGSGNDTLSGGKGNDILDGGEGDDTYLFNVGDGADTLQVDVGGTDTLRFGAGLNASTAIFSGDNSQNLIITFQGRSEKITLSSHLDAYYQGLGYQVESFVFNDATYSASQILDMLQTIGTIGNDELYGSDLSETLIGGAGNDYLFSNNGDDTLIGGDGNDYLSGGEGNDTYIFSKGDDQDAIADPTSHNKLHFDSSVSLSSIVMYQDGSTLQIGYTDSSGDLITISNQNSMATTIERFELSNGQYMTDAEVNQILSDMASYATTNSISLTSLDDVKNDAGLVAIVNGGWHS